MRLSSYLLIHCLRFHCVYLCRICNTVILMQHYYMNTTVNIFPIIKRYRKYCDNRWSIPTSSYKFLNDIPHTTHSWAANRNIYIHGTRELTLSHSQFTTESSPHTKSLSHNGYIHKQPTTFFLCLTNLNIILKYY